MAVLASTLIENHPDGVFRFTNLSAMEDATFRLKFRVHKDGEVVDFTGCTVEQCGVYRTQKGELLFTVGVTTTADGWVSFEGVLTTQTPALINWSEYPSGFRGIFVCKMKDSSTFPFYLVAPSPILLRNAVGSTT